MDTNATHARHGVGMDTTENLAELEQLKAKYRRLRLAGVAVCPAEVVEDLDKAICLPVPTGLADYINPSYPQ